MVRAFSNGYNRTYFNLFITQRILLITSIYLHILSEYLLPLVMVGITSYILKRCIERISVVRLTKTTCVYAGILCMSIGILFLVAAYMYTELWFALLVGAICAGALAIELMDRAGVWDVLRKNSARRKAADKAADAQADAGAHAEADARPNTGANAAPAQAASVMAESKTAASHAATDKAAGQEATSATDSQPETAETAATAAQTTTAVETQKPAEQTLTTHLLEIGYNDSYTDEDTLPSHAKKHGKVGITSSIASYVVPKEPEPEYDCDDFVPTDEDLEYFRAIMSENEKDEDANDAEDSAMDNDDAMAHNADKSKDTSADAGTDAHITEDDDDEYHVQALKEFLTQSMDPIGALRTYVVDIERRQAQESRTTAQIYNRELERAGLDLSPVVPYIDQDEDVNLEESQVEHLQQGFLADGASAQANADAMGSEADAAASGAKFDTAQVEHNSDDKMVSMPELVLAMQLVEAGIFSDEANLDDVRVVIPPASGLFYLQQQKPSSDLLQRIQIEKIETALNLFLLFTKYYPEKTYYQPADVLNFQQTYARNICAFTERISEPFYLNKNDMMQEHTVDTEWNVRQSLAYVIETLQLPYRLRADFRCNVKDGNVAIEFFATHEDALPYLTTMGSVDADPACETSAGTAGTAGVAGVASVAGTPTADNSQYAEYDYRKIFPHIPLAKSFRQHPTLHIVQSPFIRKHTDDERADDNSTFHLRVLDAMLVSLVTTESVHDILHNAYINIIDKQLARIAKKPSRYDTPEERQRAALLAIREDDMAYDESYLIPAGKAVRRKDASAYTLRVALLLASFAFRASTRIQHVWVQAVRESTTRKDYVLSVDFDRARMANIDLHHTENLQAIYHRFVPAMRYEDAVLRPILPLCNIEDQRFCPARRYTSIQDNTTKLRAAAARALGSKYASGLTISQNERAMYIGQELLGKLYSAATSTCAYEHNVRELFACAKKYNDPLIDEAARRCAAKLVHQELACEPATIVNEFVGGGALNTACKKAVKACNRRRYDAVIDLLEPIIDTIDVNETYVSDEQVSWQYFANYVDRARYNVECDAERAWRAHVAKYAGVQAAGTAGAQAVGDGRTRIDKRTSKFPARTGLVSNVRNVRHNKTVMLVPDALFEARMCLSVAYGEKQQLNKAIVQAQRLVDIAPVDTRARMVLINSLVHAKKVDEAQTQICQLMQLAHENESLAFAYYNMAHIQAYKHHQLAAKACYDLAIHFLPELEEASATPAHMYLSEGRIVPVIIHNDGFDVEHIPTDDIQEILQAYNIPIAPTKQTISFLLKGTKAAINAELFSVARNFVRHMFNLTQDDVFVGIARSIERSPQERQLELGAKEKQALAQALEEAAAAAGGSAGGLAGGDSGSFNSDNSDDDNHYDDNPFGTGSYNPFSSDDYPQDNDTDDSDNSDDSDDDFGDSDDTDDSDSDF